MKKLIYSTMTLILGLVLSGSGCNKFDALDQTNYYGTWKYTDGSDWSQITISSSDLFSVESYGGFFTFTDLTWTPITSTNTTYPTGFAIIGKLINDNGSLIKRFDGSGNANIGDLAIDYWYISSDGKSLTRGSWVSVNHEPSGLAFVKK